MPTDRYKASGPSGTPPERWSRRPHALCSIPLLLAGCLDSPPQPVAADAAQVEPGPALAADTRSALAPDSCAQPSGAPDPRAPADAGVPDAAVPAASPAGADGGPEQSGRPSGVADCYSAASRSHPATLHFMQALKSGALTERAAVIQELQAAGAASPDEEQFALLLGHASLWRLAEPDGLEAINLPEILGILDQAQSEFERAYTLCPTDHRIPSWIGGLKIRAGRIFGDDAAVAQGYAILRAGMMHYPSFVQFATLLVNAELPASDPDFAKAVAATRDLVAFKSCEPSDPACQNPASTPHNLEGALVYAGDVYAKAQDRAAALETYMMIARVPSSRGWLFQSLVDERIRTLDARIAAAASPDTSDSLEWAWSSTIQCDLCHHE